MLSEATGKLWGAMKTLATSDKGIRERLQTAFGHELAKIDPDELPESQRKQFVSLLRQLSRDKAPSLTVEAAEEIATGLFDLFEMVTQSADAEFVTAARNDQNPDYPPVVRVQVAGGVRMVELAQSGKVDGKSVILFDWKQWDEIVAKVDAMRKEQK